ncbi:hypothetical protein SAMN05421505_11661 [Sinosporangium album]|uniref:Lipoprotein n=1 Tax=Sinosporangium album TaxID=504805 RepID=A0A1G8CLU1_9ACTN|nr:hypothetical protein [Sinosporangium album]SDH46395.1 hypothetical protein SAMN05421505_11661 [Sinosporangium album]
MPRKVSVRLTAPILAMGLLLTACSNDEPTVSQAAKSLEGQILKLLEKRSARDIQVTDPGGKDIPCGDDRFKRTYAATGRDESSTLAPGSLNALLLGTMPSVAKHTMLPPKAAQNPNAISTVSVEVTKTFLTFNSSTAGVYSAQGETACLSRS